MTNVALHPRNGDRIELVGNFPCNERINSPVSTLLGRDAQFLMSDPESPTLRYSLDRDLCPADQKVPATAGDHHTQTCDDTREEEQQGSDEPAPKRRKTQLACDECRSKKIKCDGARPSQ